MNNPTNGGQVEDKVEALFQQFEQLSPDQKVELVSRILRSDANLVVMWGGGSNNHVTDSTIFQINLMNNDQVADVLDAVASRIRTSRSNVPSDRD